MKTRTDMTPSDKLAQAAQAVIARWDSPLWRQEVGTNDLINAMRAELAAFRAAPGAEPAENSAEWFLGQQSKCRSRGDVESCLSNTADEPKLDRDVQCGNMILRKGLPVRMLIERAERELAYQERPEVKAKRLADGDKFLGELRVQCGLAAPQPPRCPYCDDTGDVHSADGEWRGACACPAGAAPQAEPQALPERPARIDECSCQGPECKGRINCKFAPKVALSRPSPQALPEPVAWRDHVEDRIRGWRQRTMSKSGDMLAIDDFMDADSIDDLVDYVCDQWAEPAQPQAEPSEPVQAQPEPLSEDGINEIYRALGISFVVPDDSDRYPSVWMNTDRLKKLIRATERAHKIGAKTGGA